MMARFGRSLSSEWRKVTATKTWWILALVFLGYAAMMAAPFAFLYGEIAGQGTDAAALTDTAALTVYSTTATFGYVIPLVFGALAATNELRHGTLGVTFAIEPRRGIVLAGKAAALAIVGAILALAGLFGAVGAGVPVLAYNDVPTLLAEVGTWGLFLRVAIALRCGRSSGSGSASSKNQASRSCSRSDSPSSSNRCCASVPRPGNGAQLSANSSRAAMDSFVGRVRSTIWPQRTHDAGDEYLAGMGAGFGVLAAYAVVPARSAGLRLRVDVD